MRLANGISSFIMLSSFIVTGCTTAVPVVSRSMQCNVSHELLDNRCDGPKTISADATYETVVDAMLTDRQSLLECVHKMDALRESIIRCNQQSAQFNNTIDEINRRSQ